MRLNVYKLYLLIITALATLNSCNQNYKNSDDCLGYKINYIQSSKELLVIFEYASDENGEIKLKYENNSWGDENIFDCIASFNVIPEPTNVEFDRDSSYVIIKTTPNQNSQISYAIKQDFEEKPINQKRYRPIIDSTYFHVLGMRLFMLPAEAFDSRDHTARIHLSWKLPEKWPYHSSFGIEQDQEIVVNQEELYSSIFVGGDFRRYEFKYKEKPVYFLSRGNWEKIQDDQVLQLLKEVIQSQYTFWDDEIIDRYSVTLLPTYEKRSYSIGGSGLTDSFVSFASNNKYLQLDDLRWLYNHELMHKWISQTIKIEEEVTDYWFSEGFTDYYAYKLMLKNNDVSLQEYLDIYNNTILKPHYTSNVGEAPNSDLTYESYWSNYDFQKLPYRRGMLYAFFIDNQIKKRNHNEISLDNMMKELKGLAETEVNFRVGADSFKELLVQYLDDTAAQDFDKYILEGSFIESDNLLVDGLEIISEDNYPQFKLAENSEGLLSFLAK